MSQMTAVEITAPGAPDVLQATTRPLPRAAHGQVVIALSYAGVNRPDALQRAGLYNPPAGASDLPGLEGAGHIAEVGSGVTEWAVGDEVCALLPGGGYACRRPISPSIPMSFSAVPCRPVKNFWCMAAHLVSEQRPFNWRIYSGQGFLPPQDLRRNAKRARISGQSGR